MKKKLKIAVIIPCYNEELTVSNVIREFAEVLPEAEIYVIDNNSVDNTAILAEKAGAKVLKEYRQGKGYAVRNAFDNIESDILLIVDGDMTYPAKSALEMISLIEEGKADMVVGNRHAFGHYQNENKRAFHGIGNTLVTFLINLLFHCDLKDIMSGYRAVSGKVSKTVALLGGGFEVETEITLRVLELQYIISEIPIQYSDRPEGSFSKLNTFKDGYRVIRTIFGLFKDHKPFTFFMGIALFNWFMSILVLPLVEIIGKKEDGLLSLKLDLSMGFQIIGIVFFAIGIILHSINKQNRIIQEMLIKNRR